MPVHGEDIASFFDDRSIDRRAADAAVGGGQRRLVAVGADGSGDAVHLSADVGGEFGVGGQSGGNPPNEVVAVPEIRTGFEVAARHIKGRLFLECEYPVDVDAGVGGDDFAAMDVTVAGVGGGGGDPDGEQVRAIVGGGGGGPEGVAVGLVVTDEVIGADADHHCVGVGGGNVEDRQADGHGGVAAFGFGDDVLRRNLG